MTHKKIELIINTKSKRGREALPRIVAACKENKLTIDAVNHVTNTDNLRAALKEVKKRSPHTLIVGSGDGTISEVVDYLAHSNITLGVIPLGTTNNFARSLNLPLDIGSAVKVVSEGHAIDVDLGKMGDDYFSNVAGIGLSARIAEGVTNRRKRRFGRLAYPITGFGLLLNHKPFFVTVADKDGELKLHFQTHQVIVANGRYHAGKEIAADASLESRELIIFKLGGKSKIGFLWHMFDFYFGKRRSVHYSSYLIGKDLRISTSTPQLVELDGEVKMKTPLTAEVCPKAMKVYSPRV